LVKDFIYQGLMEEDVAVPSMVVLRPKLAERVAVDFEEKKVRVTLRKNARFSDGSELTADDVLYSWELYRTRYKSAATFEWTFGSNVRIRRLSRYMVQIHFVSLNPGLFREAAFRFLGDLRIVKTPGAPVPHRSSIQLPDFYLGTGPYQVIRASRDHVLYDRNSSYWDPQSVTGKGLYNADSIDCLYFRDEQSLRLEMLRNEVTYYRESNNGFLDYMNYEAQRKGFNVHQQKVSSDIDAKLLVVWFNTLKGHVDSLALRQAINLAWDGARVNNSLRDGLVASSSPASESPYHPRGLPSDQAAELIRKSGDARAEDALKGFDSFGYELASSLRGRDRLKLAMELLKADGYSVQSSYGELVLMKAGVPVELKVIYYVDHFSLNAAKRVQMLASVVKKLGIRMTIRQVPDIATLLYTQKENAYDMSVGWIELTRATDPLNVKFLGDRLLSNSATGQNVSRLKSPLVDMSLNGLQGLLPGDPQYKLYAELFLRGLSAHMPFIIIGEPAESTLYSVKDVCLVNTVMQADLRTEDRTVKSAYFGCAGR
jgi:ABC-type transport system substrate-binding protein